MKYTAIMIPLVLALSSAESDMEVIEVFRVETVEELETALTDGYPMPWLEEILNDESIPEEDRYWLDCRVRAAIAQDLHLFFDRESNPVHIEADWIAPGEDYWREHVMVRPVLPFEEEESQSEDQSSSEGILNLSYDDYSDEYIHEPFSENSPTLMSDPPGEILNLYGEQVGELAVVNRYVVLSRDASIGAVQSGGNERICNWDRTPYACILYPDGSFIERPFDATGIYRPAVSADGSTILFICNRITYPESNDQIVDAYIFDQNGNLINRITPPEQFYGTRLPQISLTGDYCCYPLLSQSTAVIDCAGGNIIKLIEPAPPGRDLQVFSFSPCGKFLCFGGHAAGIVIRLNDLSVIWVGPPPIGGNDFSIIWCSEDAKLIACTMRRGIHSDYYFEHEVYTGDSLLYSSSGVGEGDEEMVVSPNGSFLLTRSKHIFRINETSLPLLIQMIQGGE